MHRLYSTVPAIMHTVSRCRIAQASTTIRAQIIIRSNRVRTCIRGRGTCDCSTYTSHRDPGPSASSARTRTGHTRVGLRTGRTADGPRGGSHRRATAWMRRLDECLESLIAERRPVHLRAANTAKTTPSIVCESTQTAWSTVRRAVLGNTVTRLACGTTVT